MPIILSAGIKRGVLVGVFGLAISSCGTYQDKVIVGGTEFCVPRENQYKVDTSWVPNTIPSSGFAFVVEYAPYIPSKNEKLVKGFVDEVDKYTGWRNPLPGTQFYKEITSREGRSFAGNKRYLASRTYDGYKYLVWKPGEGEVSLNSDYTSKSELIAICRVPKREKEGVEQGALCTRMISVGNVAVQYSFSDVLLSNIESLDKELVRSVISWKCVN